MPVDTPAEIRYDLLAIRALSSLNAAMIELRKITPLIRFALCNAIDLGQLLQIGHDQRKHGQHAALGHGNALARDKASDVKAELDAKRVAERLVLVKAEYAKRRAADPSLRKTSILKSMAAVTRRLHEPEGPVDVPVFGSYGQLVRDLDGL